MTTDRQALRAALELILTMEAETFRAQAQALIAQGVQYVTDAAEVLQRSQFSPSARLNFRARVSGMLRRLAHQVADLGWQAGGGAAGKYPQDTVTAYMTTQQEHLSRWFGEIKQAQALPGGALRARMYAESLMGLYRQAWEAAQRADTGLPKLPAEPRDGSTQCLMFCLCHWEIKKVSTEEYDCFWRLTPAENCPNCLCRSVKWNPLKYRKSSGVWIADESGGAANCPLYRE